MATDTELEPQVYTVIQVARLFSLSRASVYTAIRAGEIPSLKIGSRIVCPRVKIDRMLGTNGAA